MTICPQWPQWKKCECNKGISLMAPIKPSFSTVMNAKDNEIIYPIYDHDSLSTCCFICW